MTVTPGRLAPAPHALDIKIGADDRAERRANTRVQASAEDDHGLRPPGPASRSGIHDHASLNVGPLRLRNNVLLAPMSGVSDLPFRTLAWDGGAGLVVSEMVASEELVRARRDVLRRTRGANNQPLVIQLAGREARWMAEGTRIAQDLGAEIIDINMGCPAREVTGKLSGSALMRDLDHALTLIDAVVGAAQVPVTLKMRLGWDERSLNAPELASRAESAGVKMITVHGRTRCQFYKGEADWDAVKRVREATALPLIVNGDIKTANDARQALARSGADGVMIGRGAYGAPWQPGVIAAALGRSAIEAARFAEETAEADEASPSLAVQRATALTHVALMLEHYGPALGLRNARKHICWYLERAVTSGAPFSPEAIKAWRSKLCRNENPQAVKADLDAFYEQAEAAREDARETGRAARPSTLYEEYAA
ncbi:MAG: tRNA dihydrouridine synthase DusB [Pseudomonadota bacterium]